MTVKQTRRPMYGARTHSSFDAFADCYERGTQVLYDTGLPNSVTRFPVALEGEFMGKARVGQVDPNAQAWAQAQAQQGQSGSAGMKSPRPAPMPFSKEDMRDDFKPRGPSPKPW